MDMIAHLPMVQHCIVFLRLFGNPVSIFVGFVDLEKERKEESGQPRDKKNKACRTQVPASVRSGTKMMSFGSFSDAGPVCGQFSDLNLFPSSVIRGGLGWDAMDGMRGKLGELRGF